MKSSPCDLIWTFGRRPRGPHLTLQVALAATWPKRRLRPVGTRADLRRVSHFERVDTVNQWLKWSKGEPCTWTKGKVNLSLCARLALFSSYSFFHFHLALLPSSQAIVLIIHSQESLSPTRAFRFLSLLFKERITSQSFCPLFSLSSLSLSLSFSLCLLCPVPSQPFNCTRMNGSLKSSHWRRVRLQSIVTMGASAPSLWSRHAYFYFSFYFPLSLSLRLLIL